ncbi:hypothetical protein Chor_007359 [Crotalus horridus]
MSERRRSAVALSSRAHAFSVEALIGSHKKRKLRDWDAKGLDLSMESLSPDGQLPDADDPAQCLDLNPARTSPCNSKVPVKPRRHIFGATVALRPSFLTLQHLASERGPRARRATSESPERVAFHPQAIGVRDYEHRLRYYGPG